MTFAEISKLADRLETKRKWLKAFEKAGQKRLVAQKKAEIAELAMICWMLDVADETGATVEEINY